MSNQIEQFTGFALDEPPPRFTREEIERFQQLANVFGMVSVAGALPISLNGASVDKLLRMLGPCGDRARQGVLAIGPYICSSQIGYRPEGVMLYEQVTQEVENERPPAILSILSR